MNIVIIKVLIQSFVTENEDKMFFIENNPNHNFQEIYSWASDLGNQEIIKCLEYIIYERREINGKASIKYKN